MAQARPADFQAIQIENLDLLHLHETMLAQSQSDASRDEWLLQWLHLLVRLTNAAGALYGLPGAGQEGGVAWLKGPRILSRQALAWHPHMEDRLLEQIRQACQQNQVVLHSLRDIRAGLSIIAAPVPCYEDGQPSACEGIALLVVEGSQGLELFVTVLQLVAGYSHFYPGAPRLQVRALLPLLHNVLAARDFTQATQQLLNTLEQSLGCQRVALVMKTGGLYRLQALSRLHEIRRQADFIHIIESYSNHPAVLAHAVDSRAAPSADVAAAVQRLLGATGAARLVSLPLAAALPTDVHVEADAVLVLLWPEDDGKNPLPRLLPLAALLGGALRLQRRAHPSALHRAWLAVARSRWKKILITAVPLILAAILLIPVPHRLTAACTLEPMEKRFAAMPFNGQLRETHHIPGDLVRVGEVLAQLDDKEIHWKLSSLRAEFARAHKQKDIQSAARDTAAAQLSALEMERLQAQIDLLQYQAEHLDIKSPIDGILLSGDWRRATGTPLEQGRTLFEIAPLQRMLAELALPAEDIAHAATGQQAAIALAALPRRQWQQSVLRIRPRAEPRGADNVFILETELDNTDHKLRPGMQGKAKIQAGDRALGWVLFHKVWERIIFWFF